MKIFFRLWALLTRQQVVCLRDIDGDVVYTVARKTPFGLRAKRHWPFNILVVELLDGGKVGRGCYVHEWRKA